MSEKKFDDMTAEQYLQFYLQDGEKIIHQTKQVMAKATENCLSDIWFYKFITTLDAESTEPPRELLDNFWSACKLAKKEIAFQK